MIKVKDLGAMKAQLSIATKYRFGDAYIEGFNSLVEVDHVAAVDFFSRTQ